MWLKLIDRITIWTPVASDGFGGITWSAPLSVDAAIAQKQQKFTDKSGDQRISKAVCYTEAVEIMTGGAKVLFYDSSALSPPSGADDVRAFVYIPSCDTLKKAWF